MIDALPVAQGRGLLKSLRLLVEIARPRVLGLVVFTGLPALLLGNRSPPDLATAAWILLGTGLAGVSSSAFNAWWEREADARMARTRHRPLPAASMLPGAVLAYAVASGIAGVALLWLVGGPVAAFVAAAAIAFYVFVYTIWLKPRTPQNIVIGGAAGGVAPLIASAAVDGTISAGAWVLFLIIFLWTPPHFWGIALYRRQEYEAAGFPMMPSVVGDQGTRWRSLAYALVLLPVTLVPVGLGDLGVAYAGAATVLGAGFVGVVARSLVRRDTRVDYGVFQASVAYLGLLFLAMLGDLAWRSFA
jgi:protoheme IX farnesyltransferase